MMNLLIETIPKKDVVGMDLGATSIKFARLVKKKEGGIGVSCFTYPEPFPHQNEKDFSKLKNFLKKQGIMGARVASTLIGGGYSIKKMDFPKMPEADLLEAIRWQMRDVVEGNVKDYAIRYSVIDEYQASDVKKLSLLAYAAKKADVRRIIEGMKKLSLKPVVIEPEPVSLLATVDGVLPWQEGEYYAVVDIGELWSHFIVASQKKLFFYRLLSDLQGRDLRDREEADLNTKVAVEIQKVVDAFCLAFRKEKIHRLFVAGGGALLPKIQESLTRNLAIPTEILEVEASPIYDVAIGLALYSE